MILDNMVPTVSLVFEIEVLHLVAVGNLVGWNFFLVLLVVLRALLSPRGSGSKSMILDNMVPTISLILEIKIFVFVTISNLVGWNFPVVSILGLDSP